MSVKTGIKRKNPDGGLNASKMRESELRIDQYINRKKAEICDMTQPTPTETRQLRLYMYNHHYNQGVARDADRANKPPYWSFYIWGHFVEPGQTTIPAGAGQKKLNRWTEAMQSIEMRFEEEGGTQLPEVVRWERDRHTGAHRECMEVHRIGRRPTKVRVTMVRNFAPEYHHVVGPIGKLLPGARATRGQAFAVVTEYVAAHCKIDADDPAIGICDDELTALFGERRLNLPGVLERIASALLPSKPVILEYTIQVQGKSPTLPDCYDVEVGYPLKEAALKLPPFLDRLNKDKEIQACNEEIIRNMKTLHDCHRRYRILGGFGADPVRCTQLLIAEAAKNVRIVRTGVEGAEYSQVSASEHFKGAWAQDAVVQYLQKCQATGRI